MGKIQANRGGKLKMKRKMQKGVTLMVLVITIVLMLIIAGASVSMIFDSNGMLKSSQEAKNLQENYYGEETNKVDNLINMLDEEMKNK